MSEFFSFLLGATVFKTAQSFGFYVCENAELLQTVKTKLADFGISCEETQLWDDTVRITIFAVLEFRGETGSVENGIPGNAQPVNVENGILGNAQPVNLANPELVLSSAETKLTVPFCFKEFARGLIGMHGVAANDPSKILLPSHWLLLKFATARKLSFQKEFELLEFNKTDLL